MSFNLTSPITGAAQTGFSSPTYTLSVDTPVSINAKQWAVTAAGGTQAGVTVHSIASPFTVAIARPSSFKGIGQVNPITGKLSSVPRNTFKIIVRKAMLPLAGQAPQVAVFTLACDIPAGADIADPANIRAAVSALVGALSQQSAGLGDTFANGLLS